MIELEKKLLSLLHGEHSSLYIQYNDHSSFYMDADGAIQNEADEYSDWVSEEEKQKAIEKNSVWTLQWYPDTPIGFCSLSASSLTAVVNAALKGGNDVTD